MPDRDLRVRIEYAPIDGTEMRLAVIRLGPLILRQVPVTPDGQIRQEEFAAALNALIDARITELLAANTAEVERRRQAEARAEALHDDWQEAQDWYRQHEKAIRAAGIDAAPDFMVPF